jgi:membrane associated rhomboid family serine protease
VANVAVYMISQTSPGLARDLAFYPPVAIFRPWTVVTYMFLHGGFGHLFFNMLGLFFFGPRLEDRLGTKGFLLLYFGAGIGGAAAQTAFATAAPMIGASAGVYGVLVGFAVFWPREKIIVFPLPIPIEVRFVIGAYLVLALYQGVGSMAGGIAHFAHLGGAVFAFGFLKWWEWKKGSGKRAFQKKASAGSSGSGFMGDRIAIARWQGISVETLHELNRDEVERLLAKAKSMGTGSLTSSEREFLDRMAKK